MSMKLTEHKKLNDYCRWVVMIVLLLLSVQGWGKTWSAEDVPMVHLQDRMRYVCDPEGLMAQSARDSADYYLHRLEKECGVQSVFVVVGRVKNADCFRMAQDIGNRYGVGNKDTRRGLVVVIAVDDHKYFIAPGKGLEGDLTDLDCDDIARACIVKNMRANDVNAAVATTAKAVFSKLKTGSTGIQKTDDEEDEPMWFIVMVLVGCFALSYLLYRVFFRHRGGGRNNRHDNDDLFPPFIFFGGGGSGGTSGDSIGGSFGGGSFGGGGSGGSW